MFQLSFKTKIISFVAFATIFCAAVAISGFLYFNEKELVNGIINKERTIQVQLSAAADYVATQGGLNDVIEKFKSKHTSAKELTKDEKKEILNQVPIYAAMVIGEKNSSIDHYKFRVFSNEPRNKDNKASENEKKFLDFLNLTRKA